MSATTNFLQFDPNLTNAEADSVYLTDSVRLNGGASGEIFGSLLANKAFYQWSTFIAAFAQMMVNKGFTVLDSNFANLVAVLANVKTSADFASSIVSVAYATSIAFNAAQSSGFDLTLTGNVSASTLTGFTPGQLLVFWITQDATGNRTFVWPSALSNAQPICALAGSTTVQMFQVRANGSTIMPVSPMLWISASGLIVQPTAGVVFPSSSGTVSSSYSPMVEIVNCSGGNVTRTLYSAVGAQGNKVTIKRAPGDTSTNQLIVQPLPLSGQTIDGFPNFGPINPYNSFDFLADGANWNLV